MFKRRANRDSIDYKFPPVNGLSARPAAPCAEDIRPEASTEQQVEDLKLTTSKFPAPFYESGISPREHLMAIRTQYETAKAELEREADRLGKEIVKYDEHIARLGRNEWLEDTIRFILRT
jgi:hypothetical protein